MNFEQLNKNQIDEVITRLHLSFGYSEAVVEQVNETVLELWSEDDSDCFELELRLVEGGSVRLYDRLCGFSKTWVFVGIFADNISELFE